MRKILNYLHRLFFRPEKDITKNTLVVDFEKVFKVENFDVWFIQKHGLGIYLRRDKLSTGYINDYLTDVAEIPLENQDHRAVVDFFRDVDDNWLKLLKFKREKDEMYERLVQLKLGKKKNKVQKRIGEIRNEKNKKK